MFKMVITLEGLYQIIGQLKQPGPTVRSELQAALEKATLYVEEVAKREAPVATGNLRDSITHNIGDLTAELYIRDTAPYGVFVHEGTRPHWAPLRPLQNWVAVKFGGTPQENYRIARRVQAIIAMRGTRANPFFDRAATNAQAKVDLFFDQAVNRIRGELSQS